MRKALKTFLLTASFTALGTPAMAQTVASTPAEEGGVEDIIVTAQKRSQSLQDIPLSITAVSGDALKSRQISSTADLTRAVAGFTYTDTGVNAPVYSLRGVGYFDYSVTANPAVTVYIDEIPLSFAPMTQGSAFDLQRVEVLKGPQGTLFGQNSTGGLVNFIANKPTAETEAGVTLKYGSYHRFDAEGYVSGSITETLRFRAAGQSTNADGWQRSLTRPNDRLGKIDKRAGRAILEWDATPDVKVTLNANGYIDKSEPTATQVIAITPLNPARALPSVLNAPLVTTSNARLADWNPARRPFRNDRFWQTSGRVDAKLTDDIDLTSLTAYSKYTSHAYIDRDGMDNVNSEYGIDASISSFFQELRLSGKTDLLNWTVGGSYSHDKSLEVEDSNALSTSSTQNVFGVKFPGVGFRGRNKVKTLAAFASADWQVSDTIGVTTGLRYTNNKRDFAGCTLEKGPQSIAAYAAISAFYRNAAGLPAAPFVPVNGGCITLKTTATTDPTYFLAAEENNQQKADNLSWRVAINYKPNPDLLAYVSATRGFKAGNSAAILASATGQYAPVEQEKLTSYEAGFKARLFDRMLQLNGAAFYYDYRNKQARSKIIDIAFGAVQALVNIPKSHAWGAELEAQLVPVDNLTISSGVAYLNAKIDRWTGYDAIGLRRSFNGQPFSFAPKWQANTDVNYKHDISGSLQAFIGGSYSYRSKTTSDYGSYPLFDIKSYSLLDARLGIQAPDGKWKATVYANNLTNTYYWHSTIRVQDTTVRYAGMPRTFGVSVETRF